MSFGDHIEELRWRLWSAIKGLLFCMAISFIADMVGDSFGEEIGWKRFGVGRPVLKYITSPIEDKVREFYADRDDRAKKERDIAEAKGGKRADELGKSVDVRAKIPMKLFDHVAVSIGGETYYLKPINPDQTEIEVTLKLNATDVDYAAKRGERIAAYRPYLSSLGITESFMVYFKVTMLCGVILACPWIFYQFWAFIGAGLYPHEKKYVYRSVFPSVILFILGIVVCQALVMPGAIKALLGFNAFIDVDPDLRLNEWLGFALMLPLVFGISFQTPLVMVVLNRIGMFTWQSYAKKWKIALFALAVFSAIITPTPDAVTMCYLLVPMFGLYCLGVFLCYWLPPVFPPEEEDNQSEEVAV